MRSASTVAAEEDRAEPEPPSQQLRPYSLSVSTELHLLRHMIDAWRGQTTPAFTVEHRSGHLSYAHRCTLTHLSDEAVIAAMRDFTALANLAEDVRRFNRVFGMHETRRGRCVQSLCACLASILERYELMLLPFDNELRRQTCALAAGLPFVPVVASQQPADGNSSPPQLGNVPLTLLSFQHYLSPFIPQMILMGDIVHRAAPQLYAESSSNAKDDDAAVAAPSAASLLTMLHHSLDLHSLLCSASQSSLLFCLFLCCLLPYLEYLDEFTSRGSLHPRAEEDGFFIRRREKPRLPRVQMPDAEIDEEEAAAAEGQEESVGEEFELRLDPASGAVVAPSFLQPYAQHILLTGRSRAMVHSIRRLMRAAADGSDERAGARRGRATIRAAAPAVVDPFAFAQTNDQVNLFRSFHEGLAVLFQQRAPSAGTAAASNDLGDAFAAVARSTEAATDDSKEAEDDAAYDDVESDPESATASSEEEEEKSDAEDNASQSEEEHSPPGSAASSGPSSPSASARSKRSDPPPMLALESSKHDASSTALVVASSSSAAASATAASTSSASAPRTPIRPLTSDERAALSIFMDMPADFDNVHSMFKPPPAPAEEDSDGADQPVQNSKQNAPQEPTTDGNPAAAASTPRAPSAAPSATTAAPFAWPRPIYIPSLPSSSVASFFSPVMLHNEWTIAAAADAVRGTVPSCFEASEQSGEEQDAAAASTKHQPTSATISATQSSSSAFLASYPLSSSLPSLQRFVDLLLFHARFPPDSLHGVVGDCLIEPLRARYQAATQEFSQQITEQCGLNHVKQKNQTVASQRQTLLIAHSDSLTPLSSTVLSLICLCLSVCAQHLAGLREFFLMSDGFMSHDLCHGLFERVSHRSAAKGFRFPSDNRSPRCDPCTSATAFSSVAHFVTCSLLCALQLNTWDVGVVGLNHLLQDSLARHSSPMLRRFFAQSLRLILVARPMGPASASSPSPSPSGSDEVIALENPQGIDCLDQLSVCASIPWPLDALITSTHLAAYNRIWRFLLQLKRASMALNECGLPMASAAPHTRVNSRAFAHAQSNRKASLHPAGHPVTSSIKFHRNVNTLQHSFFLLRSELLHVVSVVTTHVFHKTTTAYWGRFQSALRASDCGGGDAEQIVSMHQTYLDSILSDCLLTPKLHVVLGSIKRVLGLCLDLKLLHDKVIREYMEGSEGDYYFVPPTSTAAQTSPNNAETTGLPAWRSMDSTRMHNRRGSVDGDDDAQDVDDADSASGISSPRPPSHAPGARKISLAGVRTFVQFRTRLFETGMAQLHLIRSDLRENMRFILMLISKIVENGVNTQCQSPVMSIACMRWRCLCARFSRR